MCIRDRPTTVRSSQRATWPSKWGAALGIDAGVAGKWARIGGSTDLLDAMGADEGRALLKQRGR
eukprot:6291069-Prymnesium_polylepis.2